MGVPLTRRSRARRARRGGHRSAEILPAVLEYAELGWPVVPGAHPLHEGARACSCDRVGCPDPGAHPLSPAWRIQATADPAVLRRWWEREPEAGVILPTGRVFDVFDVPHDAGRHALASMENMESTAGTAGMESMESMESMASTDAAGIPTGPVAENGDRVLFFVATRGRPEDEDEWWSCQLDCDPETIDDTPGLRWHCRDSYVLAPPSALPGGGSVTWLRPPDGRALPDPLRVLDRLADALD